MTSIFNRTGNAERGQNPVPRGGVVAVNHVARLFPAQHESLFAHFLEDVAVTHRGLDGVDPFFFHRQNQTQVRHNRDYQGVSCQFAFFLEIGGQHAHDFVAVDQVALGVNCQAAICVPIESHPEVTASSHYLAL